MSETPETDALSDILRRMRLQAEIYARPDYCGNWAVDTSGQRKVAFHLIERGSAWLHTTDSKEAMPLVTGDLVLFPRDAPHAISGSDAPPRKRDINLPPPDEPTEPITSLLCGFFEFESRSIWPLLDGLPEVVTMDLRESSRSPGTAALMQLIVGELARNEPGTDAVINQLANVLFVHVLRAQMAAGLSEGLLRALADPKIGRALNAMHADISKHWSVDELAAAAAMSRSAFAQEFSELVGLSPMRYLAECRMQEARDLLERSDASMLDIALQVGYQSEAAFRKAFRKLVGETPGSVRRRSRA